MVKERNYAGNSWNRGFEVNWNTRCSINANQAMWISQKFISRICMPWLLCLYRAMSCHVMSSHVTSHHITSYRLRLLLFSICHKSTSAKLVAISSASDLWMKNTLQNVFQWHIITDTFLNLFCQQFMKHLQVPQLLKAFKIEFWVDIPSDLWSCELNTINS